MRRSEQAANAARQVVELREAAASLTEHEPRRRIERVADALAAEIGGRVPKSRAAELLGISTTALDHWIDVGALPVGRRSGSSREEVVTEPFLKLLLRVRMVRAGGRDRAVVATALRDLNVTSRCRAKAPAPVVRRPTPNLSDLELRHDYRQFDPGERVVQAASLSRQATRLAAIGGEASRGSR